MKASMKQTRCYTAQWQHCSSQSSTTRRQSLIHDWAQTLSFLTITTPRVGWPRNCSFPMPTHYAIVIHPICYDYSGSFVGFSLFNKHSLTHTACCKESICGDGTRNLHVIIWFVRETSVDSALNWQWSGLGWWIGGGDNWTNLRLKGKPLKNKRPIAKCHRAMRKY